MNNKERVAVLEKVLGLNVEPEPINATRCIGCGGINISSKDKVKLFCDICLMLGRGYNE